MLQLDLFSLFYDIIAYLVAFRSLIDEILYKLGFKRSIDVKRDLPNNLRGHVAIVTGGTRGLGLTIVRSLITKGCFVFVATSQQRCKFSLLEKKIYHDLPKRDPETGIERGTVSLQYLDLSSMDSVQAFIKAFKQTQLNVNYLICNAGIMFSPRQLTVDGFESHLAVNYLGHCLLILELLPELKQAADKMKTSSRIVSVSSSTHQITKFRFDDLLGETDYSSSQAYAQSKLAQIMFSARLSRHIKDTLGWNNVQTFSLHPGVVLSDLYEHVHLIKYFPFLVPIIKLVTRVSKIKFMITSSKSSSHTTNPITMIQDMVQGAETTLYAALSTNLKDVSGIYLEDCDIKQPSKISQDVEEQEHLWELTKGILSQWLKVNLDKPIESR